MTTTLKDMLNARAESAPGPDLDVAAAMRRGRRRIWRNRAAGGTAACAAATALAVTAPTVLPGGDSTEDAPPPAAGGARLAATYATGSQIHYGDETIDVAPHDVRSFVQTDDGFVFTTAEAGVYFTDGGTPEQIGEGNLTGTLEADDAGGYVAWVENEAVPLPEFVVYDTGTGSEVVRTSEGNEPGMGTYADEENAPYVNAVDGDLAYWHDARGIVAWNLTTGTGDVILAGAYPLYLLDVAAGQLVRYDVDNANGLRDLVVGADPSATTPRFPGLAGTLSPGADYVAGAGIGGDTPTSSVLVVSDVATGDDVTPTATGYREVLLAQWLSDDEYAAAGTAADGSIDLLTCSISSGSCDVAADDIGTSHDVRLPTGQADPLSD